MVKNRFFAVIPAAGSGSRVGAQIPKQYLTLAGQSILAHSVQAFLDCPEICMVFVVVSAQDQWIEHVFPTPVAKLHILRCGGASRAESVSNGLAVLAGQAKECDWVLVHDAARPGIRVDMISAMIGDLCNDEVGGLLALPVVDTVKRDTAGKVVTLAREHLWLAQTPQMFRFQLLRDALLDQASNPSITDEASAIEAQGLPVRLLPGHPCNFKVTQAADLAIAQMYLQAQKKEKA